MENAIETEFATYFQKSNSLRVTLDKDSRKQARETDRQFLVMLIKQQKSLSLRQKLVLEVDLSTPPDVHEGDLDGYAGVVLDARFNLARQFRELLKTHQITIDNLTAEDPFPQQMQINIPPDILPTEDFADNSTASRNAWRAGEIRRYLYISEVRDPYLDINYTGTMFATHFNLHPSVISGIHIEDLGPTTQLSPIVQITAINRCKT